MFADSFRPPLIVARRVRDIKVWIKAYIANPVSGFRVSLCCTIHENKVIPHSFPHHEGCIQMKIHSNAVSRRHMMECLAAGLAAPALTLGQAPPRKPAVWIGPPGVENGKSLRALFEHPEQWSQTRSMVDGLLYADHNFKQFSDDDLRLWFSRLREWKLRLSLEVGAVKEWGPTGDVTFNREHANWDRIKGLGGNIYSIAMDEPFLCARDRLKKPNEYAVEETARFMALARERYPEILIGDIEPYPSISIPDHQWWIENLNRKLREKHVHELDFYRIDTNWINFTVQRNGSWKELKQLEQYCRGRRLPFSLIYWPADLPSLQRLGRAGESTWYISIMRQAQDYAVIGGAPDEYVIESWVGAPSMTVPETDDWTFTRSVRDFVERFVAPARK
jgi:hypothetical protein